jgi:hypothetical protein
MPLRTLSRIALPTGLLVAFVSPVRAEPANATAPSAAQAAGAEASANGPARRGPEIAGFDILASVAYGVATSRSFGIDLEPYSATFGLETGYTWKRGPRLGVYCHYGLGGTRSQMYTPRRGAPVEIENESSALVAGLSLGFDLPLHFLVLRYTLGLGLSWMKWDFGEPPVLPLGEFQRTSGTNLGFHLSPGLTLLWPIRVFEIGIGFDYMIQTEDAIPPGILSKLLIGVEL